jgi:hypothetical protein
MIREGLHASAGRAMQSDFSGNVRLSFALAKSAFRPYENPKHLP